MFRLAKGSFLLFSGVLIGGISVYFAGAGDDQTEPGVSSGPRLADEAVLALAEQAAEDQLLKIGTDLASVDGGPINTSHLELVETAFEWQSRELISAVSSYRYGTSEPADLWLVSFRASGVEMPDWGISDGIVEVRVVLSDTTGEVVATDVARLNPNAGA